MFTEEFEVHAKAGFGGIWIVTDEQYNARDAIISTSIANGWQFHSWTPDQEDTLDTFLKDLDITHMDGETRNIIMVFNPETYVNDYPEIAQRMLISTEEAKRFKANIVVISAKYEVPGMLSRSFAVIDHDLPDIDELQQILESLNIECEEPVAVATAAAGLTRSEAQDAYGLSYVRNNLTTVTPKDVWGIKAKELKKSGSLELYEGDASFDDLCGLDALKNFCIASAGNKEAKGVLLLGVPGAGKSQFAKSLGNAVGLPTISMDFGSMMGSLVGQTEERIRRALKTVDRLSPCILFVDEIEKALSGASGSSDSGVSERMLGTLLTWLNDRTSATYFIGTCNDIQKLSQLSSGAFVRAERFDGVFYIGLPTDEQRDAMWRLYIEKYKLDEDFVSISSIADKGWTGAEIKACCRLASLMNVTVEDASQLVIPVCKTAEKQIQALDEWAEDRALDANLGGPYSRKRQEGFARTLG